MKKGLLLSLVASTVLFAGGDIAPVEPVAEAPVAACDDFYGHAGVGVIYDEATDTATYGAVAVLGVTKEIFSGLTLNAEVQGGAFQTYDVDAESRSAVIETGGLTQFNLGYTWCNTAIKVGRFAVPAKLSPLVATSTDYFGLKRDTFEGVLVANTDLPDTTLWAAYLYKKVHHANTDDGLDTAAAGDNGGPSKRSKLNAVAGGFRNTSFADTVITAAGYYHIDTEAWELAGSIDYKWCDTDLSLGGAYASTEDYVVGAYVVQHFDATSIKVGATYGDMVYKKYTVFTNQATGTGANSWAIGAAINTDWCGYKLGAYGNYREDTTYQIGASVAKAISGINFALDYRYQKDSADAVSHRVRTSAVYKF